MRSPSSSRAAGKQPAAVTASGSRPTAQGSTQSTQAVAGNTSSIEPFIQRLATSAKSLASATATWLPSDAQALRAATHPESKGQASRAPAATASSINSENLGLSRHYNALSRDQPSASNVFRTAASPTLTQPTDDGFDYLTTPRNAALSLPHTAAEGALPTPSTFQHSQPLYSPGMHHHEACQDIMQLLHHSSSTGLMDAVYMPNQGEAERRHITQQAALISTSGPTRINQSIRDVLMDPTVDGLVHQYLSQSVSYTDDVYGPSDVAQDGHLRTPASSIHAAAPTTPESSTLEQAWDQQTASSQSRQAAVQRLLMFQKHLKPRL
ncbi:hypothetical protein H4R35_005429 [Dimargaris xerosporica]|nr:hypothetical protein H4R35_005429 [Dimargaris xerosporica]